MYGNLGDRDACTSWAVVSIGVPAGLSDCSAPGDSWVLATHPFSSYPQGDSVAPSRTSTRCLLYSFAGEALVHAGVPQGDWSPCCFLELWMRWQLPLDEESSILHGFGLCAFLSVTVLRVQSHLGYENNGLGDQHQGQILTAWAIWANLYTFVNRWSSLPPLLVAALWCSNPCANTGAIFREEGSSDVPNHLSLGTCTCLCH